MPPFAVDVAVTADTADRSPRMVRDGDNRIILTWLRFADVLEVFSDDDGETWSEPLTVFTGATQTTINVDEATGLVLRGALISNEVVVSRQYPGDAAPGVEIPATVYPGAPPLELDDAGFHFSMAHEGPARWVLTGVAGGEVVNYASADDGATWELLA